jgi:hypothetical protein
MSRAVAADDSAAKSAEKVWVTDFRGKPPFARRAVSAAEFARFEEAKAAELPRVGERLHVVHARGRPPFRRELVDVDASNVTECASACRQSRQTAARLGASDRRLFDASYAASLATA